MSQSKNHWYVLVLTGEGPKFVTGQGEGRTAIWDKFGKPREYSRDFARSMAIGLTWNGHAAFPVCIEYEIVTQPFMYEKGCFEWKWEDKTHGE